MFSLSFDWAVITSISLQTPFYSSCNYFAGLVFSMWILVPILWYYDFWNVSMTNNNRIASLIESPEAQNEKILLDLSIKALATTQFPHDSLTPSMRSMMLGR
jgi:hypothetical protein